MKLKDIKMYGALISDQVIMKNEINEEVGIDNKKPEQSFENLTVGVLKENQEDIDIIVNTFQSPKFYRCTDYNPLGAVWKDFVEKRKMKDYNKEMLKDIMENSYEYKILFIGQKD
jgi:hypothetical protein